MGAFQSLVAYRVGWTAGIGVYKLHDGRVAFAEGEDEHGLTGSATQYRYLTDDQVHAMLGMLREAAGSSVA